MIIEYNIEKYFIPEYNYLINNDNYETKTKKGKDVSITQSDIEKLRMLDVSGKVIRDIKISNQYYVTFHKRDLPKGIYFIEITTNEKKYLQKIIIH